MEAKTERLKQSLDAIPDGGAKLAVEFMRDLGRRHPGVLGETPKIGERELVAALSEYALSPGEESAQEWPDQEILGLADSLMKSFARCIGRSAWKPEIALAWNERLRHDGRILLATLREQVGFES